MHGSNGCGEGTQPNLHPPNDENLLDNDPLSPWKSVYFAGHISHYHCRQHSFQVLWNEEKKNCSDKKLDARDPDAAWRLFSLDSKGTRSWRLATLTPETCAREHSKQVCDIALHWKPLHLFAFISNQILATLKGIFTAAKKTLDISSAYCVLFHMYINKSHPKRINQKSKNWKLVLSRIRF